MRVARETGEDPRAQLPAIRQLANQVFSRASGAPLREGNRVTLLKDAAQNYPAWLAAIDAAQRTVHFEMYILHEDEQGQRFADALLQKAREGVEVKLLYDWMGGFGKTSRAFWNRLRAGGVDVRCYNAPRFSRPLGWLSRDHRKTIIVDGTTAFVTGLCVGDAWVGNPARHVDPWRDTGVELHGAAVADVEAAFADAWAASGSPLQGGPPPAHRATGAGGVALRVVATVPNTAGLYRVDQLVAAIARSRRWLTDAYFAGITSYVQALRAAARDGVDVRLLVPGASDIPIVSLFSRAGYRPLLESGVRVFEWNGPMIHAKTAVADGRWARVGSTNLNIASWMGNRELDVLVEDEPFAREMEDMFLNDLTHATEVVLERRHVRPLATAPERVTGRRPATSSGGTGGRIAAGMTRVGNTVVAAIANTRVLESVEANIAFLSGMLLGVLALLAYKFPRAIAYPFAVFTGWLAITLLFRGLVLSRQDRPSAIDSRYDSETEIETGKSRSRRY